VSGIAPKCPSDEWSIVTSCFGPSNEGAKSIVVTHSVTFPQALATVCDMGVTKQPRKPGVQPRRTLDAERQKTLLDAVALGNPLKTCCLYAGIDDSTLRKWRIRGENARAIPSGKRSGTEQKFVNFVTALEKALAEANVLAQKTVNTLMGIPLENATDNDKTLALRAAQFHLTHRDPENYSTSTKTTLEAAEGSSAVVMASGMDVFEMLLKVKQHQDAQDDDDAE
jgi:hypothetical protein